MYREKSSRTLYRWQIKVKSRKNSRSNGDEVRTVTLYTRRKMYVDKSSR